MSEALQRKDQTSILKAALNQPSFVQALKDTVPLTARKYLTPERIVRIVVTASSRNQKLLQCRPQTILQSVVDLVQLGLEPGGPLGQAYLVPYGQDCTPMVGYQGYLALARRSGEIDSVFAQIIYSKDTYKIRYGDNPSIEHEPCISGERGEPVAAYCVAKFKGGGSHLEVMTVDEIDSVRKRSRASNNGPWVTDWGQMARKTVIKRARHYWPMSVEMAQASEIEDRVDTGEYFESPDALVESPADAMKAKLVVDAQRSEEGAVDEEQIKGN